MDDKDKLNESRMFNGPGSLKVFVPPVPPPQPGDYKLDFPPGKPPEVRYYGFIHNYWEALREGEMPYENGTKRFSETQMEWLRSIEPDVEKMIMDR